MSNSKKILNTILFFLFIITIVYSVLTYNSVNYSINKEAIEFYGSYSVLNKSIQLDIDSSYIIKTLTSNNSSLIYEYKFLNGIFVIYENGSYQDYLPVNDDCIYSKTDWAYYFKVVKEK